MYRIIKQSRVSYNADDTYYLDEKSKSVEEDQINSIMQREKELEERISKNESEIALKEAQIIKQAKDKAFQIISDAEKEKDMIFEESKQEGLKEGLKLSQEKSMKAASEVDELKSNLHIEYEKKVQFFEEQILDLAVELSRKIIDIEFKRNDEAVLTVLKDLINKFRDEKNLIIELSEENAEKLNNVEIKKAFKIKSNNELDERGILLNSEHGIIDASIDVQFNNLKNSLLEE